MMRTRDEVSVTSPRCHRMRYTTQVTSHKDAATSSQLLRKCYGCWRDLQCVHIEDVHHDGNVGVECRHKQRSKCELGPVPRTGGVHVNRNTYV